MIKYIYRFGCFGQIVHIFSSYDSFNNMCIQKYNALFLFSCRRWPSTLPEWEWKGKCLTVILHWHVATVEAAVCTDIYNFKVSFYEQENVRCWEKANVEESSFFCSPDRRVTSVLHTKEQTQKHQSITYIAHCVFKPIVKTLQRE